MGWTPPPSRRRRRSRTPVFREVPLGTDIPFLVLLVLLALSLGIVASMVVFR